MMNNKQWKEEFYQKFGHIQIIKDDKNGNSYDRITDFISALLKEREAEIRKEINMDIMPKNYTDWDKYFSGWEENRKEMINKELNEIRKETILAVLPCKVKTTIGKESKYFKEYGFDRNNFATGHNQCRQSIIDSAKEKFNITI